MIELAQQKELTMAIDTANDALIDQIVKFSTNPSLIIEQVRTAVPVQQMSVDVKNVKVLVEESCLWLMPVVARPGAALVFQQALSTENSPVILIKEWLQEWFGAKTQISLLSMIPDYFAFAKLSPGQVRQSLHALNKPNKIALPNLQPGPLGKSIEAGLPILGFVIGSATKFAESPCFSGSSSSANFHLQNRVRASMPYISGDYEALAIENYRVGTPMPMTQALTEGMKMWISELEQSFDILAWDLIHSGFSNSVLSIRAKNPDAQADVLVRMPMSLYQFGADGIQNVVDQLPAKSRKQDNELQDGGVC